ISYSTVRAMTRVATPENEEFLLQIARYGTAAHVERLVRKYRRVKKLNEPMDEWNEWRGEKQFFWYENDWGMYVFNLHLPPEDGAIVLKALEALVEELNKEKNYENGNNDADNHENVSAETFLQVDSQDWEGKRADAMTLMAEHCLKSMGDGIRTGGRFEILMHVNANPEHIDYKIDQGASCYLDDGHFLAPEVARRLACDANLTTVLEDDKGSVLNIKRKSRVVPPAIEKAVRIRDQGFCRFPSCCHNKWIQLHHVIHWADGGETSVHNLVSLCHYHHRLLHSGEYRIYKDEGSDIVFINKHNQIIKRSLYPQFPGVGGAEALVRYNQEQGIEIDAETALTRWTGESMDDQMALEVLAQLEEEPV
ncbi:MAG: DUF222 domain-containing protein, partial [Pseudomonadales bacterium]